MADYWKSQPRKHCDLCKCWIADNKPSRDFHERGKRHQQAVKDKLTELKKKGVRDAKKQRETEGYLAEMERDALKKFKKDLADNPELAKQYSADKEGLTTQQKDKIELEKTLKGFLSIYIQKNFSSFMYQFNFLTLSSSRFTSQSKACIFSLKMINLRS